MTDTLPSVIPQLDPLPLPGPAWLLWSLLILTFTLHLLAMNYVLGGSVIAVTARMRKSGPAAAHRRDLVHSLAKSMPIAIAATVTFGVAPLLFVQALYGRLFFTGSVVIAWFWFAVIPLLILGYYGAYLLAFKGGRTGRSSAIVWWLTTACFVLIAFIYANNMSLMLRPDAFATKYLQSGSGWQLNLDDPALLPRYLHHLLGAIAVAGLAVAHYGLHRRSKDADPAFGEWAIRHGALWFSIVTALNIVPGMWWLIAMPRGVMMRFMGASPHATAVFGIGVLAGLAALMLMTLAVYAPDPARPLRVGGGLLVLTLVLMVLARDQVRRGALEQAAFAPNPWVDSQWGPIIIFAVLLVAAIATVAWMLAAFLRGKAGSQEA